VAYINILSARQTTEIWQFRDSKIYLHSIFITEPIIADSDGVNCNSLCERASRRERDGKEQATEVITQLQICIIAQKREEKKRALRFPFLANSRPSNFLINECIIHAEIRECIV
jgi:hypothetical protein